MATRTSLLSLMSSFAVVVKAGSFTKAAARLGVSKSVASRHVSALEKALGVQLMYRSTHTLSLTEAGERFHSYCRDLDQVAEQAVAVAMAAQGTPRGQLRLILPQTLVVSPVGRLIAGFQRKFPEVQLDVRVTSLQVDPVAEGFDLALRIGDPGDSNLVWRKIRDVRFQAVAAPAYLERHGWPRTPEALSDHNCLVYSEFASRTRGSFEADTRRRKPVPLSGNLSTNSGVLLMNALLAGQGVAIGPDIMFEPHVKRGEISVLLPRHPLQETGLYAVYPPGRFPSAGRAAFIDFLIEGLARQ